MILRVVSGWIPPGKLDAVVEAYGRDYAPIAHGTAGLERWIVGARPAADGGHELASMTLWTTVEAALAAYGGDLAAVRTVDGQSHGEVLSAVDYYEIDADGARRAAASPGATDAPTRLRLSAGTVARGLDSDIQQELRRQLPDLPPEAVEAWVGRRVLGPDVQIAFVSTWSAEPAERPLDRALWPSISARYDTFRIAVHDILVQGSGAG